MRAIPKRRNAGTRSRTMKADTNQKETTMSNQNFNTENGSNSNSTSKNRLNIPEARAAMDRFKMEAAAEVGVDLKDGYNGDLTSREAGSVGGQMVKKMVESYEKSL